MTLLFDTETNSLRDPRLLQLACLLVDFNWNVVMSALMLVRPNGWTIEEGAEKVHGISQEKAERLGIPVDVALGVLCGMAGKAGKVVGHNLDFDMKVVGGELEKAGWPGLKGERFCTMGAMVEVCKLPPSEKMRRAGRLEYKRPKLIEAYLHAFGEGFVGVHDAMADCVATLRLYRWIVERRATSSVCFLPPPPLPQTV